MSHCIHRSEHVDEERCARVCDDCSESLGPIPGSTSEEALAALESIQTARSDHNRVLNMVRAYIKSIATELGDVRAERRLQGDDWRLARDAFEAQAREIDELKAELAGVQSERRDLNAAVCMQAAQLQECTERFTRIQYHAGFVRQPPVPERAPVEVAK